MHERLRRGERRVPRKYVGAADDSRGAVVGIDRYGESAPAAALFKFFGFTAENVAAAVKRVLE